MGISNVLNSLIKQRKSYIDFLYIAMLVLWILPSGTIMNIPIKILVIMTNFVVMVFNIRIHNGIKKKYVMILFILLFIAMWTCLGIGYGYADGVKSIIINFGSLLLSVLVTFIYLDYFSTADSIKLIYNVINYTVIFFIGFKIVMELTVLLGILSFAQCETFFKVTLNAPTMMLPVQIGGMVGTRLSTPNDTIPLIFLSFDFIFVKRHMLYKLIQVFASFFYVFIVFSRVVFMQYALIFMVALFIIIRNLPNKKRVLYILGGIVFLSIMYLILNHTSNIGSTINELIELRFAGKQIEHSDDIRKGQFYYLFKGFCDHPLFGNGLGSYSRECIRSSVNPASYELEYVSFFFQFGLIGFILIIGMLMFIFFKETVLKCDTKTLEMMMFVNFMIWAVKPFFNPQFLSSSSGMVISVLAIMAVRFRSYLPVRMLLKRNKPVRIEISYS